MFYTWYAASPGVYFCRGLSVWYTLSSFSYKYNFNIWCANLIAHLRFLDPALFIYLVLILIVPVQPVIVANAEQQVVRVFACQFAYQYSSSFTAPDCYAMTELQGAFSLQSSFWCLNAPSISVIPVQSGTRHHGWRTLGKRRRWPTLHICWFVNHWG